MFMFNEFIIKKAKLIDDYIYIKKYLKYFYIKRYFFCNKCNSFITRDFQFANLIEILKLCIYYWRVDLIILFMKIYCTIKLLNIF